MNKINFFDGSIRVERIDLDVNKQWIGTFEESVASENENHPIALYAKTLRKLRTLSQDISSCRDEILYAQKFKSKLNELGERLGLLKEHFSVDTNGDPLLVRGMNGEHIISPTHFERGAYFSHPHADHQLNVCSNQIPSIKIGKYVRFGRNAAVNAGGNITIGDGVWLSPGCLLLRQDHDPYGIPAIGARTTAMTRLPPIRLCDYAWVGRDAMMGWNGDYIGKASIIGTRSFVNSWVGDYSIVGDHGRILQYLPFKAFFLEKYKPTIDELMKITDWEAINSEWLNIYNNSDKDDYYDQQICEYLPEPKSRKVAALLIEPQNTAMLKLTSKYVTDVISSNREKFANFLQWTQDEKHNNIRFRSDLDFNTLPFSTAGYYHYRRKIGYDLVIVNNAPQEPGIVYHFLEELERILSVGGHLLYPISHFKDITRTFQDLEMTKMKTVKDIKIGTECFILIKKIDQEI